MKSTSTVTDGPASSRPRVAEVISARPGSTFGTGISGTWAVKTSDKHGLIVLSLGVPNVVWAVVQGGVGMLDPGLIPAGTSHVPVVAGLDGGVTNTSPETSSPTLPVQGLGGRGQSCRQNKFYFYRRYQKHSNRNLCFHYHIHHPGSTYSV
jgi:hypothetical protein